jgi:uncharacterized membrane protein
MGDRGAGIVAQCVAVASGPVVDSPNTVVEWMLPPWAPNLHPVIVHFPIAWLIAALVVDLVSVVLPRATWAATTAACLYPAGAVSALAAYLTGRQAAAGVLIPGMAQPILRDHWNWALATTICFAAIAAVRLLFTLTNRPLSRRMRVATVAVGLAGMLLLFHTGEQGARLVFEHGVGVVPQRHSPATPSPR